jgi:hypothetical protein
MSLAVTSLTVTGRPRPHADTAGAPVTSVHPNLTGLADRTFGPTDRPGSAASA